VIGGKVLDPSALAAYIQGSIGMAAWLATAKLTGLVLYLPALALIEARAVFPDRASTLNRMLGEAQVVHQELDPADAPKVATLLAQARVFDATAGHVVLVARQRGWSVLTAHPGRVLRVAPDLDVDEL
jgi:hypothetical protein